MSTSTESGNKLDIYSIVTDSIIRLLEEGTIPWQKPWMESGIPMNLLSKRSYRGINLWLLLSLNYERNLFLTWDQLKKLGGSVKQGEHGHVVIFWQTTKKTDDIEAEEQKNKAMLRYYKVFNIEQCKDIPENMIEPVTVKEHDVLQECEEIIKGMPDCPRIKYHETKAYYNIEGDFINMPNKKRFKKLDGYYATFFHELVHSTGHKKRLDRSTITEMAEFGSESYSIEELVAELGAAYLCSTAGILKGQIKNSAAYIQGWLGKLRGDKGFIIRASGQAQKSIDYILNAKEVEISNGFEQTDFLA